MHPALACCEIAAGARWYSARMASAVRSSTGSGGRSGGGTVPPWERASAALSRSMKARFSRRRSLWRLSSSSRSDTDVRPAYSGRDDRDLAVLLVELHDTVLEREEGPVAADAHILALMVLRAALADDYVA